MYHPEDFVESEEEERSSIDSSPDVYRQASRHAALKKSLTLPCQPTKECCYIEKASARILTSAECLLQMKEKEEQKEEKRKRKEENQRKREQKRIQQLTMKQATKPGEDACKEIWFT